MPSRSKPWPTTRPDPDAQRHPDLGWPLHEPRTHAAFGSRPPIQRGGLTTCSSNRRDDQPQRSARRQACDRVHLRRRSSATGFRRAPTSRCSPWTARTDCLTARPAWGSSRDSDRASAPRIRGLARAGVATGPASRHYRRSQPHRLPGCSTEDASRGGRSNPMHALGLFLRQKVCLARSSGRTLESSKCRTRTQARGRHTRSQARRPSSEQQRPSSSRQEARVLSPKRTSSRRARRIQNKEPRGYGRPPIKRLPSAEGGGLRVRRCSPDSSRRACEWRQTLALLSRR